MTEIKAMVDGGKATAGPPIGPALGPLGINAGQVCQEINEKTKDYAGMKVPVTINVDDKTKEYTISVGSPPTSALIIKEAGASKGSATPHTDKVGNLTKEQVVKVARMKSDNMQSYELKPAVKQVVGTCQSLGVNVEGKKAREAQKEIDDGNWDDAIKA